MALIVSLLVAALVIGGGAGIVVWRHNARIAAENDRAASAAQGYRTSLGQWHTKVARATQPEPSDLLNVLYLKGFSKAERDQVAASCKEFATYGTEVAALPDPPTLTQIPDDIAGRVPEYREAASTASQQRADFEDRRSTLKKQLADLSGFCAFYAKEWRIQADRAKAQQVWRDSLWDNGHREVIGNWVYTCSYEDGCIPNVGTWPGLVSKFEAAFTAPDAAVRDLYRDSCPYPSLKKACQAVAATFDKAATQDLAMQGALKEQREADFFAASDKAEKLDIQAALRAAVGKATGESFAAGDGDPAAVVLYRAVSENLAKISEARLVTPDTDTISS